ncbi:cytochrome C assembly family protein [Viridibacterium curvum]|uniref:Cytochrome c biogenesis protein CcsA n=1 Tax=Viridibacterium curvum TaxID=1101404 RepID=A0ABP9Q797_9RHOO
MDAILLHLVPASAYALLALVVWRAPKRIDATSTAAASRILLAAGLLTHGFVLGYDMLDGATLRFGLAPALSLTLWLALVLYFAESFVTRLDSLLLLALPVASVCCLLPLALPGDVQITTPGWGLRLHLVVAMLAYSLFALAALHAVMLAVTERRLHHAQLDGDLDRLPPLLTVENLLFRLIAVAFVFLSLTLASGLLLPDLPTTRPLTVKYKLGFTAASWLVFGVLLAGRHLRGWRGRVAQRWTGAGFTFLLLAYAGTHFVLEVLFKR